ncbi:MAG: HEAT repeat domain-containing protein [bacterium]|nr:HEAT repeat domain-containing protein [bacterium]
MKKISWKLLLVTAVVVLLSIHFVAGGLFGPSENDLAQRIALVRQIAANGSLDDGSTLVEIIDSDPSPEVRREAMTALSYILKTAHLEIIRKKTEDPDAGVRKVAVDSLALYADMDITSDLIKIVKKDSEEEIRLTALHGLARCGDPRSVVALLDMAEHGSTRETKLAAMKCLLQKFGVRISEDRDPANDRSWRDLIQRWKQSRRVHSAYLAAGVKLVQRPQDIIGKDYHPERRVKTPGTP